MCKSCWKMFWQRLGWRLTKHRFYYSKEFCVCSVSHLADLLGNICSLERVQKVMICDWWILIRFVCFFVTYYSLGQSSTSLLRRFFLIFRIFVTSKNKATSASFPRQKFHQPWLFPSLFLRSLLSFSVLLHIVICNNLAHIFVITKGPFFESPCNFSGPKSNTEIEI